MSATEWHGLYETCVKTIPVVRDLNRGSMRGVILRFPGKIEAESFEEWMQPKAWGNSICSLVEGYTKTLTPAMILDSIRLTGELPLGDKSRHVAIFEHVDRSDIFNVIDLLQSGFNESELTIIKESLSMLDWCSLRYVGKQIIRIGINVNILEIGELDEIIMRYQDALKKLCFPRQSKKQILSILQASNSLYFADLGTGGG
ncbi:hypothetical protein [Luteolibacter pohnpeiensis]|nr:hypothetical protein [Luteolibacter pohnpeiensis]